MLALVVVIAAFAAYFLSFPLYGPLLADLPASLLESYLTTFMASTISGSLIAGTFADRVERKMAALKILAILLILAVFIYRSGHYIAASAIQGLAVGAHVVFWGALMSRKVKPWRRATVFAVSAAIANIYLLLVQHSGHVNQLLAALPLVPVLLLPEVRDKPSRETWSINRDVVNFALPIVVFYILGGFMYAEMEVAFREAGISVHVLFYVAVVVVAGYLYDRFGRKPVSIAGLLLLAASYVLFNRNLVLSALLIQSSYGFVDVFSMIIWADLARYGSEGKHYAIGFSVIMASLLAGYKAILYYSPKASDFEAIALILLIFASVLIALVREPKISQEDYLMRVREMGGASQ
ncbi:hypothetical protein [Geoglobus ahangari]